MMDAMPIAVWDLHASPLPPLAPPSLRWSSDWDHAYFGPSGQMFHHRIPNTNQAVLTFEIHHPARFVFHHTLDRNDELLDPNQLHDIVKDMVYID
jgi:hypothetical protein